jgi:hypothetical protein
MHFTSTQFITSLTLLNSGLVLLHLPRGASNRVEIETVIVAIALLAAEVARLLVVAITLLAKMTVATAITNVVIVPAAAALMTVTERGIVIGIVIQRTRAIVMTTARTAPTVMTAKVRLFSQHCL